MPEPLVSVCIPTLNGGRWVKECLSSALNQTYRRVEVLVVDDGSTDNTLDVVRSLQDERVRIVVNQRSQGLAGNWNECVRLARGEHIKFLFQDDALYPDCIDRMVALIGSDSRMGLVFARRDLVLDDDAPPELASDIVKNYGEPHLNFKDVQSINDGPELFAQHHAKRFHGCCIAEPSSTLIRKEVFHRLGLFNTRMHQACDLEMWLRIMFFYDVGFIDEKLLFFRVHGRSASSANFLRGRSEYDHFWLFEGLLSHPEISQKYPALQGWRDEQFRRYHDSLIRPKDGWLSVRTRAGFRQALTDVRRLPDRIKFLKETKMYRKDGKAIHPRLKFTHLHS
jgi:glycosyltransferase involved in cell wall biosynthesis